MKIIYTIIIVLLILFVVTFSLQNTISVHLVYYDVLDVILPVYMLIFIVFLIGVIFSGLMGIVERYRLNRTINRLNRMVRDLKRDVRENEPPVVRDENKQPESGQAI
ncbi:Uncharacterized integral membrane protein [Syntrophus gentianae]|uniref:Uncharacterized integral membrane protein n=1 Tax=Syntrophus gentianae TaxID=43775 RepID=A0A1H7XEI4_9BACT|nr:LapA family protein [Syntrophus gentianae]SEM32216.1 Uncharacterized integral membrane protein [Syntrophus gentianae]